MGNTVWTKNAKEGFTDEYNIDNDNEDIYNQENNDEPTTTPTTTNSQPNDYAFPADYGNDPIDGDAETENVLKGKSSGSPKPSPTPTEPRKDTVKDKITDLFKKFDLTKATNIYKELLDSIANGFIDFNKNVEKIVLLIFGNSLTTPTAKSEIKMVASQISRWITVIPLTYTILVNWWYITCYTNFTFDFRQLVWSPAKWILAGPLNALEALNYRLLTFRMDSDRSFPSQEMLRSIWSWRPIVFTLCHMMIVIIFEKMDLAKLITTFMSTNGLGYIIVLLLSVYYFFSLFVKEKWYEPIIFSGMVVAAILIACLILSFIMMFVFVSIVCPLFSMYLIFLSYFAIIVFNGFWPFSIWSSVNQIFQELKEAYTQDPMDKFGKLGKATFNNFHSIYLLLLVTTILLIHMTQIMSFKTPAIIGFAFIVNVVICLLFAPNAFLSVWEILNVFTDNTGETERISPPEMNYNA